MLLFTQKPDLGANADETSCNKKTTRSVGNCRAINETFNNIVPG